MKQIKSVYFIGIGGIGMSNLARYFLHIGKKVGGYDKTESDLTKTLSNEGCEIHYQDDPTLIAPDFKIKESSLIVYTPAVSTDNQELLFFKANSFDVQKRSQVLGMITQASNALCCAGTHGKTTTSSMLAHILKNSHLDCNAFLGGILKNYDSNLLLSNTSKYTVVEADEYDRSFHTLHPYMALITSVDPDHLDIYGTEEEYNKSFEIFTSLIKESGTLVMKHNINLTPHLAKNVKLYTYSEKHGDFRAGNIRIGNGTIIFDFITPKEVISNIELGVPVRINIENSIGAMAIAWLNGVTAEELREGMRSYKGTKRRFEILYKSNNVVMIDDYAHHPQELTASINSIKELYKGKKVLGVFQPHLYSRTKDFADEFAQSLSLLDELILLDIYPAREKPIEGITSEIIYNKVTCLKILCKKEELLSILSTKDIEVLVTLGAGDISDLLPLIKDQLENKYGKE